MSKPKVTDEDVLSVCGKHKTKRPTPQVDERASRPESKNTGRSDKQTRQIYPTI